MISNRSRPLTPGWFSPLSAAAVMLFLSVASGAAQTQHADDDAETSATARVAIIGASVSAGFLNSRELKTPTDVPLAVFLRATLADSECSTVTGKGDSWLFRNPRRSGERQVDDALAGGPTLVVGVDFLFWYAFGQSTVSDPRRAKGLEVGLAQLDRIACPIVIGDLPDISLALEGKGPFGRPMITRAMLPTEDERVAMNATIRAWAEARGDVAILPLATMIGDMLQGRTMIVHGLEWTPRDPLDALQPDLLHPSKRGAIWIALSIADAATRLEGIDESAFVWDEALVRERVDASTKAAREARARKEKERAERREKADGQRRGSDRFALIREEAVTKRSVPRKRVRHACSNTPRRSHGTSRPTTS